jgi:FKBP-type peptidyl-prolyl cis-trans isomerase (trigger factor)
MLTTSAELSAYEVPLAFDAPLVDPTALSVEVPPRVSPPLAALDARARVVAAYLAGRPRRNGELVGADDEVTVRCLGFGPDGPVPFTARSRLVLEPGDDSALPGAHGHLVGAAVGTSVHFPYVLSDELDGQPHVGETIQMVLQIVSARAPGKPSKKRLKQARARVAAAHERAQDAELHLAVLDAAFREHPVKVPEAETSDRVAEMWADAEAGILARLEIPQGEQQALLQAWLENEDIRDIARLQLAATALVARFGLARGVRMDSKAAARRVVRNGTALSEDARLTLMADAVFGSKELPGLHAHWLAAAMDLLVDEALR